MIPALVYTDGGEVRPTRVYVSGPITKGNRTHNFAQACEVHQRLLMAGYSVLNPMLTMMHPAAWVIPHNVWIASDLPWVAVSDVVCRLPGESVGADMETSYAEERGITVASPSDFECLRDLYPLEKCAA